MRIVDNPFPFIKCETCKHARINHSLSGHHLDCYIDKERICGDRMPLTVKEFPFWDGREDSPSTSCTSESYSSSTEMKYDFILEEEMTL